MKLESELAAAFDEIIEGRLVNRNVHDLIFEGRDLKDLFVSRLYVHGYARQKVAEIDLGFEERVPAFAIRNNKAYFGWVFIERFTDKRSGKLFGSVARNKKGDWLIQISHNSEESIYVNCDLKSGMESERLFVLE